MKITDIKTKLISCAYPKDHSWDFGSGTGVKRDELLIFVETDEGITGIGESYHGFVPEVVAGIIDSYYKPLLTGEDPEFIEDLWNKMYFSTFQLGNAASLAISGVDQALWDIKGKIAGKPVYQLLGGTKNKTRVPLYVGCHCFGWKAPELLVAEAEEYVSQGFKAIKLRGGMGVRTDLEVVEKVRKAVGDDIDIMIDANSGYSWPEAVELATELAQYKTFWFESPFDFSLFNHHGDMGRIRKLARTPIASGGNLFGRWQFRSLIDQGGVDFITPDAGKCSGLSECIKIAYMASAYGILVAPHASAGLNMVANLHYTASIPDHVACYLEWDAARFNPPRDEVLTEPLIVEDGYAVLPSKPGFGVELDEKALAKHTFIKGGEIVRRPRVRRWAHRVK